jgi:hypothetical protein
MKDVMLKPSDIPIEPIKSRFKYSDEELAKYKTHRKVKDLSIIQKYIPHKRGKDMSILEKYGQ